MSLHTGGVKDRRAQVITNGQFTRGASPVFYTDFHAGIIMLHSSTEIKWEVIDQAPASPNWVEPKRMGERHQMEQGLRLQSAPQPVTDTQMKQQKNRARFPPTAVQVCDDALMHVSSPSAHNINITKEKIAGTPNSDIHAAGASTSALTSFVPYPQVSWPDCDPDFGENTTG